jgi:hypothetical protein
MFMSIILLCWDFPQLLRPLLAPGIPRCICCNLKPKYNSIEVTGVPVPWDSWGGGVLTILYVCGRCKIITGSYQSKMVRKRQCDIEKLR